MSLLLCHQCLSWTRPRNSRCTICAERVDLGARDPSFEELAQKIGAIEHTLGVVSFPRKLLPDLGTVYVTTNGFIFLPHRQVQEPKLVTGNSTGSSIFWIVAGLAFTPIGILTPFLRKKKVERKIVPVLHPVRLEKEQSDRLPLFLMNHPGVLFISLETVGSIKKKGSWWFIKRKFGGVLRFRMLKRDKAFHHNMQQLLNIDPWSQFRA